MAPVALAYKLSQDWSRNPHTVLVFTESPQQSYQVEQALRFFAPDNAALRHFPDWETLPYDHFSPQANITSERLATLRDLRLLEQPLILICSLSTALQRLAPVQYLAQHALKLAVGMHLPLRNFGTMLINAGYESTETVEVPGSMARRGGIVDFFPMGARMPLRVEWFDDEIESIRYFDSASQRTVNKVESFSVLPAQEFPFDAEARARFASGWRERFPQAYTRSPLLLAVGNEICPPGIECYLSLFCTHTESIFDYLPDSSQILLPEAYRSVLDDSWAQVRQRWQHNEHNFERPPLDPEELYLSAAEFDELLHLFPCDRYSSAIKHDGGEDSRVRLLGALDIADASEPIDRLGQLIQLEAGSGGRRFLFCLDGAHKVELVEHLLRKLDAEHEVERCPDFASFAAGSALYNTCNQALSAGCHWLDQGWILLGDNEVFGVARKISRAPANASASSNAPKSSLQVAELAAGAIVVHESYGIGRYVGLEYFEENGFQCEYLHVQYANSSDLFVPVAQIGLISPLSGVDPENVELDSLGSNRWGKARARAREQINDHAVDLLRIQALRDQRPGSKYAAPGEDYQDFCAAFPYPLTEDQANAIVAVEQDLQSAKPMDRLICGDVGFGKTEVAMRAAYLACAHGKQVAVLTPTTLLAQQHLEVFQERFAGTAVNIAGLSRLTGAKLTRSNIDDIAAGKCDIAIGTHKLLQKGIEFKDLGLVIIDEEHRFGVSAKERMKQLRAQVDILTLTATPIPRTLNFAFAGIKEMSIISTPPVNRHAIKTFVSDYSDNLVSEAVNRELVRAGQAYYLYNRVEHIEQRAEELRRLLPRASIGVAHGQLRESELEQVMRAFYRRQYDVLVASTIIESGIDVPNANTIVIERADRLGLAQLHQLRGRVGRSDRQAYAFLLYPTGAKLSKDAAKRLDAISSAHDLGSGFMLATQDLEIRGAGELLGAKQSGAIERIGFSLYQRLLKQALQSLESGELSVDSEAGNAEIELKLPATLVEDYIPDVHLRMVIYQRLSQADSKGLAEMRAELTDRFGKPPTTAENLLRQHQLRLRAQELGVKKIIGSSSSLALHFHSDTRVQPETIIGLLQSQPQVYQLQESDVLRVRLDLSDAQVRLERCEALLAMLAGGVG